MLRAARHYFDDHGYLEVDTPLLSQDIVVDAHLHPFAVPTTSGIRYLQTSPEAGMKRLLASGSGSIFQITRSFRKDESGGRHNPEFTMIEWYGVGTDHDHQMLFTEGLVRACFDAAEQISSSGPVLSHRDQPFSRVTYDDAFLRYAGQTVSGRSPSELMKMAIDLQAPIPQTLDVLNRDELLNLMLAVLIEPKLGLSEPQFIMRYPASQAALARLCQDDSRLAERFELYIKGVEICNGYYELTDPQELRCRDLLNNRVRTENRESPLPGALRLLQAMQHGLPDCSGVALGFDRLVMLAMGTDKIADVIPFPFERA